MRDHDTQAKKKTHQSCTTLLQFSGILIFISLIALSPDLGLFLLSLTIFMTSIAIVFGSKRQRIVGVVLLLISLVGWKNSFEYVLEQRMRLRARIHDGVTKDRSIVRCENTPLPLLSGSHLDGALFLARARARLLPEA